MGLSELRFSCLLADYHSINKGNVFISISTPVHGVHSTDSTARIMSKQTTLVHMKLTKKDDGIEWRPRSVKPKRTRMPDIDSIAAAGWLHRGDLSVADVEGNGKISVGVDVFLDWYNFVRFYDRNVHDANTDVADSVAATKKAKTSSRPRYTPSSQAMAWVDGTRETCNQNNRYPVWIVVHIDGMPSLIITAGSCPGRGHMLLDADTCGERRCDPQVQVAARYVRWRVLEKARIMDGLPAYTTPIGPFRMPFSMLLEPSGDGRQCE